MVAKRAEVVGINKRNVGLIYPNNPRAHYPLADDKLMTKEALASATVPIPEVIAVCDGLYAVETTLRRIEQMSSFVIKPSNGSGGQGILVIAQRLRPGVWQSAGGQEIPATQIRKHIADIVFGAFSKDQPDRAFVEERVSPHPVFERFWPNGLCDLRVLTLEQRPFLSMLRVPTEESDGRANLHQGGVGLAIDLDSGMTTRAWHNGKIVDNHPDTDEPLIGVRLPVWTEVLSTAEATARCLPLGYLGIDLVVDERERPLVLEVNVRPGLEIQNVHGMGMAPLIFGGQP